ncbi:hypothetical protein MRB53_038892 [Persea americana]|nr:hypothetical protein MRB53_038892 [Persea americana]
MHVTEAQSRGLIGVEHTTITTRTMHVARLDKMCVSTEQDFGEQPFLHDVYGRVSQTTACVVTRGRVTAPEVYPPPIPRGDLVVRHSVGWTEYAVVSDKVCEKVAETGDSKARSAIDALSVVGMTGLTAYFGILRIGEVKKGDMVVVSGAAGATGSVVGQIAKIKGATVIGIAGSDEKCRWLTNDLGFDKALNYKAKDFAKQFREVTKPKLIDVAAPFARFVMCGGISQYNEAVQKGPKNYLMVVSMRIKMQGFIVFDFEKEYASARRELAGWVKEGKLKRGETNTRIERMVAYTLSRFCCNPASIAASIQQNSLTGKTSCGNHRQKGVLRRSTKVSSSRFDSRILWLEQKSKQVVGCDAYIVDFADYLIVFDDLCLGIVLDIPASFDRVQHMKFEHPPSSQKDFRG